MPSTTTMRTRIGQRFEQLRAKGELGIVAYVTAGDPALAATGKIVLSLAEAGADVVELGVPFSDPLADGPVIQRASERALRSGTTIFGVNELGKGVPEETEMARGPFRYYQSLPQM